MLPHSLTALPPKAREHLGDLTALLRHTDHGWAFALYTTAAVRDEVTANLRAALALTPLREVALSAEQPNLLDHLRAITDPHAIVVVHDVERAGEQAFGYLDFGRETLAAQPHTFVFWVTLHGRIQTARQAANFWAQRSGTFDFTLPTEAATREWRGAWAGANVRLETSDDLPRLTRLYTTLLEEYGEDETALPQRADLHNKLASLHKVAGAYDEAVAHLHKQLALGERLNDAKTQAQALNNLGELESRRTGPATALNYYERALTLAGDDAQTRGETLVNIANVLIEQSESGEAEEALHEAEKLFEVANNLEGLIATKHHLGRIAHHRGQYVDAEQLYRQSLNILKELGDKREIAIVQGDLADLAVTHGNYVSAQQLYQQSLAILQELGNTREVAVTQSAVARLADLRGDYNTAEQLYQLSLTTKQELGDKHSIAVTLYNFARLRIRQSQTHEALEMLTRSCDLFKEIGLEKDVAMVEDTIAQVQQTIAKP